MSLRFRTVAEIGPQKPIEWLWEGRIARGYTTMLGGPGGVGKSAFMASLEVATLAGLPFLGADTHRGPIIHADFDTDARAQIPWIERALIGQGVGRGVLQDITYVDSETGGTLEGEGLIALRDRALEIGAVLLVVDAFTSAFPLIRGNDAGEVMQVMAAFRQLAADTNAAVVVLDHTPKPMPNQPEGRGLLGSTMKSAGARGVHLLSRVRPADVDGLDVLKLETHKNNLAAIGDPVGIQRLWDAGGLRFELFDLPDSDPHNPRPRVRKALVQYLAEREGQVVPRAELVPQMVKQLNVAERTLGRALAELLEEEAVVAVKLPGRGAPMAYRIAAPEIPTEPDIPAPAAPERLLTASTPARGVEVQTWD